MEASVCVCVCRMCVSKGGSLSVVISVFVSVVHTGPCAAAGTVTGQLILVGSGGKQRKFTA